MKLKSILNNNQEKGDCKMKEKITQCLMALALVTALNTPALAGGSLPEESGSSKLSWHGYGEIHFNNPKTSSKVPDQTADDPAVFDFHRLVWGMTYRFTDQISLHTEIDFEHAARELELEYSYIDFLINPSMNIRAGAMILPVGPLNEFHEPTLFYSVERPQIQTVILPTTWTEPGLGLFGQIGDRLKYRLYLVNGLDAAQFTPDKGIREGRRFFKEPAPIARNFATVGRIEYIGPLAIGASFYSGGADNATNVLVRNNADVTLWDIDLRFRKAGLDLQAIYAKSKIDGAGNLVKAGATATSTPVALTGIGSEQKGFMLEAAYKVASVVPFVRYEKFNTQIAPASFDTKHSPASTDRKVITYGLAYYPTEQVAVKADQELWKDKTGANDERFNLGLAWMF